MPKKYDLVELDGMYGLIAKDDISFLKNSSLQSYPVNRSHKTGEIHYIRTERWLYYPESFITKNTIPFNHDRQYASLGFTHYLGVRMTLDHFAGMSKDTLDGEYARFKQKHSIEDTNYSKTNHGRLMRLIDFLEKRFGKLFNLEKTFEKVNVSILDSQIPGFKQAYDYANMRGNTILNALEDKIDERLEELTDDKPLEKEEYHPSFDDLLHSASMRAAAQAESKGKILKGKRQQPSVDERSLF